MKKKQPKKLKLNRETLKKLQLSKTQLSQARGGAPWLSSWTVCGLIC